MHGGSFNYAGLYELPSEYEKLQQKALRELPHSGSEVQELSDELARRLAAFFQSDCCFLTSTGFGSNILGFPAIASKDWMIIMDEKCHNSMFSGAFQSEAGARKRFRHNDMNELEAILISVSETFSHIMVAVEGMYSMDGTLPPLARLHELKQRYGFVLYCDEAHSFLSIGRTADLIDIRSATLSKAVGAIGGFVCASSRFESSLCHQNTQLAFMCDPIPTAAVLQALWALSRPLHLARGLVRLQSISKFCHEELRRQGVFVYGEDATPMLPVYAGSPTQASELSYLLRTLGLVCPPISQPAVELWESRVRIGLSPSFTDKDVDTLVNAVIDASKKIGVLKASRWSRRSFNSAKSATLGEQLETERALRELSALMNEQIAKTSTRRRLKTAHYQCVLQAGYHALAKHGLGAGSSRFILGTFTPHLDAERVTSEYFRQPATITYADAGLGLMSTIAALCRPIWGHKRHNFLVPIDASLAVESGLRIAPRNSGTTVQRYNDEQGLVQMIKIAGKRTYITAYVTALRHGDDPTIGLEGTIIELARAQTICPQHITLIIDTSGESAFTESIPNRSRKMIQTLVESTRSLGVRVLLSGSYRSLGGPSGGYLTGDRAIVEELRYSSRSYMFNQAEHFSAARHPTANAPSAPPRPMHITRQRPRCDGSPRLPRGYRNLHEEPAPLASQPQKEYHHILNSLTNPVILPSGPWGFVVVRRSPTQMRTHCGACFLGGTTQIGASLVINILECMAHLLPPRYNFCVFVDEECLLSLDSKFPALKILAKNLDEGGSKEGSEDDNEDEDQEEIG
ncbi:Aminotran-1-2 domain containing protein [Curvularia clavata]|uniref:serine C-palmitoyltransferase n=1 Tax=Curvularia clavata TaxID=95742 RepID=A0A9Q8Z1H6_CURCL|nr:Aminotran-1-2 domain containing protein [Curvularia clavata]